jgi:hypothetical protein
MKSEEYGTIIMAINDAVLEQRRQLGLALQRKKRATIALEKADYDIAAVSGALGALQDIARRLNAPQEETVEAEDRGAAPQPPAPNPMYQTLAGPATLDQQSTPDQRLS